jgi:hypothetical protein
MFNDNLIQADKAQKMQQMMDFADMLDINIKYFVLGLLFRYYCYSLQLYQCEFSPNAYEVFHRPLLTQHNI